MKIETLDKLLEVFKIIVNEYLDNENNSVNDRFDALCKYGKTFISPEPYIQHFETFESYKKDYRNSVEDWLYEYVNKDEQVRCDSLAERLEEKQQEIKEYGEDEYDKIDFEITDGLIQDFKKECIKSRLWAFEYDW